MEKTFEQAKADFAAALQGPTEAQQMAFSAEVQNAMETEFAGEGAWARTALADNLCVSMWLTREGSTRTVQWGENPFAEEGQCPAAAFGRTSVEADYNLAQILHGICM